MMKRIRFLATVVLPVVLTCGCDSMSHTETGAAVGGGIGAGIGAIIGHATGHTAGGALIGAGAGALVGGLAGHAADKDEQRQQQLAAARQFGMTDIIQMTQQHISDEVIIQQIRTTGSVFHLSASDLAWLKQNGVSDAVVFEMQATATRYPRRVYTEAPVYAEPVVVVEPPPPPVGVGIGIGFRH